VLHRTSYLPYLQRRPLRRADTCVVPHELTAVPAARSSDKAFRVKQALVIGGVLFGAALGPIAAVIAITSKVDVPLLRAQVASDVQVTTGSPDSLLATAELVARSWIAGKTINVPRLSTVSLTGGTLDVTTLERVTYRSIELQVAGLSSIRYQSAWDVYFRAIRSDGSLVFITVPMALTVSTRATLGPSEVTIPGTPVLRAAPSLEPFTYPSKLELLGQGDVLVPAGWEPVQIADVTTITQVAQRWASAYLTNTLSSAPGSKLAEGTDKNGDSVDDVLDPPPADLQQRIVDSDLGAYLGIGRMAVDPASVKIVSGPYKATADNQGNAGHLLMTVTFGALGTGQSAPTFTPVTMTMDLLVKAESNTVLAWGPAGSGASLTPYQNHTAYQAWTPPSLGE